MTFCMEVTFCPPTKKCPKSRGVISLNKTAAFPGVERGGLETWKMGEVGSDLGRIFGRIFFSKGEDMFSKAQKMRTGS